MSYINNNYKTKNRNNIYQKKIYYVIQYQIY